MTDLPSSLTHFPTTHVHTPQVMQLAFTKSSEDGNGAGKAPLRPSERAQQVAEEEAHVAAFRGEMESLAKEIAQVKALTEKALADKAKAERRLALTKEERDAVREHHAAAKKAAEKEAARLKEEERLTAELKKKVEEKRTSKAAVVVEIRMLKSRAEKAQEGAAKAKAEAAKILKDAEEAASEWAGLVGGCRVVGVLAVFVRLPSAPHTYVSSLTPDHRGQGGGGARQGPRLQEEYGAGAGGGGRHQEQPADGQGGEWARFLACIRGISAPSLTNSLRQYHPYIPPHSQKTAALKARLADVLAKKKEAAKRLEDEKKARALCVLGISDGASHFSPSYDHTHTDIHTHRRWPPWPRRRSRRRRGWRRK